MLNDWNYIADLRQVARLGAITRNEKLKALGAAEAQTLRAHLDKVEQCEQIVVVTHVPPFPQACVHNGVMSDPDWLPWFTCVQTGKVLAEYAYSHPEINILVLCGHSHGVGTYQHMPNLTVRTGGWLPGVRDYGNPIVQDTLEI
jgi:hypothetical protein